MSRSIKFVALVALVGSLSACGSHEEEYVIIAPEPISAEPKFNAKYK